MLNKPKRPERNSKGSEIVENNGAALSLLEEVHDNSVDQSELNEIDEIDEEEPVSSIEQNTSIVEPVGSNANTYRFIGSLNQGGKLSSEVEMTENYFIKLIYMGSDGSCKVGIIYDVSKKRAIKELRGELVQMTLEDMNKEYGEKIDYPIALDGEIFTIPNSFFDEIHAYSNNYKFAYSEFKQIHLCCRKGHLLLDSSKRLVCSKCGKVLPNTGVFKPKTAIKF